MYKSFLMIALFVTVCSPAFSRHRKGQHPEICKLRSVFIEGNSEASNLMRRTIEDRTWLKLSNSRSADAVLSVSQSQSEKNFPVRMERTTVSVTLAKPDGTVLWTDSRDFTEGVFNSGAGSAVKLILSDLNKTSGCKGGM